MPSLLFFVHIIFLWNKLPASVCNVNSCKVFRSALLNHFACIQLLVYFCFLRYVNIFVVCVVLL